MSWKTIESLCFFLFCTWLFATTEPIPVPVTDGQMTANVWVNAVTAGISLIGVMFTAYMAYLVQKLNHEARLAAMKVGEVKEDLANAANKMDGKVDHLSQVADSTLRLVDGDKAVRLAHEAAIMRRLADITKDPGDAAAAVEAERVYREHAARLAAEGIGKRG